MSEKPRTWTIEGYKGLDSWPVVRMDENNSYGPDVPEPVRVIELGPVLDDDQEICDRLGGPGILLYETDDLIAIKRLVESRLREHGRLK